MKRQDFLKLSAGVLFAPYLAKIPAAKAIPALESTITIGPGYDFAVGDIIRVGSTGEAMRVTSLSARGRTATVVRGIGNTPPQPIPRNEMLSLVGKAYAEGAPL